MIIYKRINLMIIVFALLLVFMIGRLAYLQTVQRDVLIKQVTQQRFMDTPLKTLRGTIYDRNMIPFTEREDEFYVIVTPALLRDEEKVIAKISLLTEYSIERIRNQLEKQNSAVFMVKNTTYLNLENESKEPGIEIIRLRKRYSEQSLARHLIGYINKIDGVGSVGIEKAFNHYLNTEKVQTIGMISDAKKGFIPGLGYKITNAFNEQEIAGIRLTLDYHIQSIMEEVMDKQMDSGAAILTDVKTGDILALASRPNYLQDNIGLYVASQGTELLNKAFCAYDVGSVFKIIVAAAAFEAGIVDLEHFFHCSGKIEVEGKEFTCHKLEGHGDVSFTQAFAYSCNPVFIETGLQLGYHSIIDMAKRFGLGSPIDLYQGQEQQIGNIPEKKYVSNREIANISIGQGEILATPLQVVDMVTTVANNGIRKKLNIVDAVVDQSGNIMEAIRYEQDHDIISPNIAAKIKTMMEETTISGTGTIAKLEEYGGAGAKTGSAETGWLVDGKTKVHAWFVGYFPVQDPKYAMAVFVEDGKQGGSAAGPIFRDIAQKVMELKY